MSQYILRRLAISVPVLLGVTIISFLLVNLAPGDPVTAMIDPFTRAEMGDEWLDLRREQLGLNDPAVVRYGLWLREILQGNLGYSLTNGQPVLDQILERASSTILLMGTAMLLSMLIGIPLGFFRRFGSIRFSTTSRPHLASWPFPPPAFFWGLV
ncbi:MAG: ABC transporter permease [Thermomicrobiales bacterium]